VNNQTRSRKNRQFYWQKIQQINQIKEKIGIIKFLNPKSARSNRNFSFKRHRWFIMLKLLYNLFI